MSILAAAAVVQKVGLVKKIAATAKAALFKVGVGGVSQKRFFIDYKRLRDAFVRAGYLTLGSQWHEDSLTRNKIRKTQVADRKEQGNYSEEYERLRTWTIQVLNHANPSLGNDYADMFPTWPMANLGGAFNAPIDAAIELAGAVKASTYEPGSLTTAFDQSYEFGQRASVQMPDLAALTGANTAGAAGGNMYGGATSEEPPMPSPPVKKKESGLMELVCWGIGFYVVGKILG